MDNLVRNLNVIRQALDLPVTFDPTTGEEVIDSTNIDLVESKLVKLSALMGLSSETMAQAKKQLRRKELETLIDIQKQTPGLQPSVVNKLLAARTGEEESILTYADRLNSSIVHNIDVLRTVISKYKEELRHSAGQV